MTLLIDTLDSPHHSSYSLKWLYWNCGARSCPSTWGPRAKLQYVWCEAAGTCAKLVAVKKKKKNKKRSSKKKQKGKKNTKEKQKERINSENSVCGGFFIPSKRREKKGKQSISFEMSPGVKKNTKSVTSVASPNLLLLWLLAVVAFGSCPAGAVASASCCSVAPGTLVNYTLVNYTFETGPLRAPPAVSFVELQPWHGKPVEAVTALHGLGRVAVLLGAAPSVAWNAAVMLGAVPSVAWHAAALLSAVLSVSKSAWEVTTEVPFFQWSYFRDLINDFLDDPICCWTWNLASFLFGCWIRPFSYPQRNFVKRRHKRKKRSLHSSPLPVRTGRFRDVFAFQCRWVGRQRVGAPKINFRLLHFRERIGHLKGGSVHKSASNSVKSQVLRRHYGCPVVQRIA